MKTLRNYILIFSLSLFFMLTGCKKDNTSNTPDPTIQSNELLKNYQAASKTDGLLVVYHQKALITGNHDSCYIYWHQFTQHDSLFSLHFYDYSRIIYANNGGQHYGMGGWNWDGGNGMMNNGNWQCGLDTLQYQNWNGSGDYLQHDTQMYNMMQGYNMTGYFSSQANQSYSDMHALREDHYQHHNYHW